MSPVREAAERWAIFDPDPVTRGQIDHLVDTGDVSLNKLFSGRIAFGTAGLRARVGPGPNRMNALVVRQTSVAVTLWLQRGGIATPRVVVGFDARHDSQSFATHAAAAIESLGGVALLGDAAGPTPVFAHALLAEQADAAIVVTASHNPPADNGYKLYLGDGLQLVSPADAEIASVIDDVAERWSEYGVAVDDRYGEIRDERAQWSTRTWSQGHRDDAVAALFTSNRTVSTVYTAMHGVGGQDVLDAFHQAGFPAPIPVAEQFEPDPNFPTADFPNPEEPGAMDMLLALAERHQADLALANDPDADRLAIAVPSRDGASYVALSGNELGVLLADHVLRHTSGDRVVARSVVSSRQLDAMAAAHGVGHEATLTGFKWVARPIITHAPSQFVFGYEEAIGYCIGDHVRDKDGVTAALIAAEMVATLIARGQTVWDRLDELAAEHGVYANRPVTVRFDADPSQVHQLMAVIDNSPPVELGGERVTQSGPVGLGSLPATSGLHLLTEAGTQVIIRPSGTEPKIKAYVEVVVALDGTSVEQARATAQLRLSAVVQDVERALSAGE